LGRRLSLRRIHPAHARPRPPSPPPPRPPPQPPQPRPVLPAPALGPRPPPFRPLHARHHRHPLPHRPHSRPALLVRPLVPSPSEQNHDVRRPRRSHRRV